jgi:hypothetical protein
MKEATSVSHSQRMESELIAAGQICPVLWDERLCAAQVRPAIQHQTSRSSISREVFKYQLACQDLHIYWGPEDKTNNCELHPQDSEFGTESELIGAQIAT